MLQADDIINLDAGSYRLRSLLAQSAYGVVWSATAAHGSEVALKLVNEHHMARAQPALQQRWSVSAQQEIAFLRSLAPWDERHIVRLLDSGHHEGLPVMALELLGSDLARHIAQERDALRPIAFERIVGWMAQLNQALATVHQYGWIYLDLKPANVLTTGRGTVKLVDFGTSRVVGANEYTCYAGTPSWQAPEQFFPDQDGAYRASQQSDYFALGAMFYFMVSGGLQLRSCSACGQAYRHDPATAAATLLARHGGQQPPSLHDDEAALFVRRIDQNHDAQAALRLLRALTACEPCARPAHALHISRMLASLCALGSAA
ncbi:MAG: serine/threonine-protein kinase [Massilia sp.]